MAIYKQAQIDKYIKKPDTTIKVFLVYGSNEGLQAEYVKSLTTAICPNIYDPFQVVYLNGADVNADSSTLMAEYASQSLLGGRRVIVIKDADNNLAKHIKTMLETINSDTLVIVSGAGFNKKSSLVTLAESREDMAVIACYEDRDEDVYTTVRNKLVENGYTIGSEALKILCARLSNDRKTNLGEIEKLITYMGGKKDIAVVDVETIVSDASSSTSDDVCYYAAGGDSEKAQKAFYKMINEGNEPISIVRNLTYHFSKLLTVLGYMENGETPDKAIYKLVPRIIFFREPAFKRQLSFWRKDKLLGVMDLLYKCERDCKTTNMPVEEIVSYTIMQISSAAAKLQRRSY